MSDTPLPAYMDARKACSHNASVSGVLEPDRLERSAAFVAADSGSIQAHLDFSHDSAGRRRLQGRVMATLTVDCQRCLEPVAVELDEQFDLVLVTDETAAQQLDKEFDPWVCPDNRVVLADLLDEQILLGLPIVSYHQQGPCSEQAGFQSAPDPENLAEEAGASPSRNPFAVLADLKIK